MADPFSAVEEAAGKAKSGLDTIGGYLGTGQDLVDKASGVLGGGSSGSGGGTSAPTSAYEAINVPTVQELEAQGLTEQEAIQVRSHLQKVRVYLIDAINISNMDPLAGIAPPGTPLESLSPLKQRLALQQELMIGLLQRRDNPRALIDWHKQWLSEMHSEYDRTCPGLASALTTTSASGKVCGVPAYVSGGIGEEAKANLLRMSSVMGSSIPGTPPAPGYDQTLSERADGKTGKKWYASTPFYIGAGAAALGVGWALLTTAGKKWRKRTFG